MVILVLDLCLISKHFIKTPKKKSKESKDHEVKNHEATKCKKIKIIETYSS